VQMVNPKITIVKKNIPIMNARFLMEIFIKSPLFNKYAYFNSKVKKIFTNL
jgi:hypothetical protein